ncbi:hypothetical protein [Streptomyces qinzhouensis]|uniref:Uncharacterized protein n=1 Tax=Streptomyces qinzhouensis TaxID=2599401 RepID=A0A5B8JA21_9ACTN|nr:hypothetical protein [Streptomyces qinzhouensis]QDY78685.1 hypothetical protein FQU76_21635 [Streptomyces qinzhouensis]
MSLTNGQRVQRLCVDDGYRSDIVSVPITISTADTRCREDIGMHLTPIQAEQLRGQLDYALDNPARKKRTASVPTASAEPNHGGSA